MPKDLRFTRVACEVSEAVKVSKPRAGETGGRVSTRTMADPSNGHDLEPIDSTVEPPPIEKCDCHVNGQERGGEGQMLCMPVHVFAFCILLSALASGIAVASQRIWERLRLRVGPFSASAQRHVQKLTFLTRTTCGTVNGNRQSSGSTHERSPEEEEARQLRISGSHVPTLPADSAVLEDPDAIPLEDADGPPPRYIRAFCGNEDLASQRWQENLQWRQEMGIDSILNEPQPLFNDIRRLFPSYMSGRSKGGHIVVYEKLGQADLSTLNREFGATVPILLRHWVFVTEYMYQVLQPTDSAQQINIEDMTGLRMQAVAGQIKEYVRGAANLAGRYYVERCHKTFILNAPPWFGMAFRVVSPFLSVRTKQKIRILGKDLSPLLDEIDSQFLPVEYGGRNTTPLSESLEESDLRNLVSRLNSEAEKELGGPSADDGDAPDSDAGEKLPSPRAAPRDDTTLHPPAASPRGCNGATPSPHEQENAALLRGRARTDEPPNGRCVEEEAVPEARRGTWAAHELKVSLTTETRAGSRVPGDLKDAPVEVSGSTQDKKIVLDGDRHECTEHIAEFKVEEGPMREEHVREATGVAAQDFADPVNNATEQNNFIQHARKRDV